MKSIVLNITGMTCEGCVEHVSRRLQAVPGVKHVQVDLTNRVATVSLDEEKCATADLTAAVRSAGYQVSGFKTAAVE